MKHSREHFSIHLVATVTMVVLAIGAMAVYLPMLYEKLYMQQTGKTHLLFSPVTKRFIYREKIVGTIPAESYAKATDHSPEYAYRDQNGSWYTRVEFEKRLPFIYYKNMELWGLLPITIDNQTFDKETIKKHRQVWELKQAEVNGSKLTEPLYPLLESNPGQVRLSFPEDRFRMTAERMEFVNARTNRVDDTLSTLFTNALKAEGFQFPARSVHGKFSILKPFDEGVFMVDKSYHIFHLKRIKGMPKVVKTPIDPRLKTRHIKVSEKNSKAFYGLLLSGTGVLHLIRYDNYGLIPLPLQGYDAATMDIKLVMNPLYTTAVYSDELTVHGVTMQRDWTPVTQYRHQMSRAKKTLADSIHAALFPFCLRLNNTDGQTHVKVTCTLGGALSLWGIGVSLLCLFFWHQLRYRKSPPKIAFLLVALTGVYGLIVLLCLDKRS